MTAQQLPGRQPHVPDEDLRITLARIEAKLDVTLPAHGERLNEHARILDAHDIRLRKVEQAAASSDGAHRLPNWVPIVASLAGVATIIAMVAIALMKR